MEITDAVALLEKSEDDFNTAENLTDSEKLIEACNILNKYNKDFTMGADHDILYLADYDEKITEEDMKRLQVLGIHLDEDLETWAMFT